MVQRTESLCNQAAQSAIHAGWYRHAFHLLVYHLASKLFPSFQSHVPSMIYNHQTHADIDSLYRDKGGVV